MKASQQSWSIHPFLTSNNQFVSLPKPNRKGGSLRHQLWKGLEAVLIFSSRVSVTVHKCLCLRLDLCHCEYKSYECKLILYTPFGDIRIIHVRVCYLYMIWICKSYNIYIYIYIHIYPSVCRGGSWQRKPAANRHVWKKAVRDSGTCSWKASIECIQWAPTLVSVTSKTLQTIQLKNLSQETH